MPSKSQAQARLMNAVAHSPQFAQKVGIPRSVGQEFHQADKAAHPKMLAAALRKKSKA